MPNCPCYVCPSFVFRTEHKELLIAGLSRNPRRIKRFLRLLSVQLRIAAAAHASGRTVPSCMITGEPWTDVLLFMKLMLISYRFSELFQAAVEDPGLLGRLQRASNLYEESVRKGQPSAL